MSLTKIGENPIYASVVDDQQWSPDELSPTLDLRALIQSSYDRPRRQAVPPTVERDSHPPESARRGRSSRASSTRKPTTRSTTRKPASKSRVNPKSTPDEGATNDGDS